MLAISEVSLTRAPTLSYLEHLNRKTELLINKKNVNNVAKCEWLIKCRATFLDILQTVMRVAEEIKEGYYNFGRQKSELVQLILENMKCIENRFKNICHALFISINILIKSGSDLAKNFNKWDIAKLNLGDIYCNYTITLIALSKDVYENKKYDDTKYRQEFRKSVQELETPSIDYSSVWSRLRIYGGYGFVMSPDSRRFRN